MKVSDIVVLKNGLNSFYLVLEQEKHLFEIVKIYDGVAIIKSLSTEVEVAVELESIRLATLKERYLRDGNVVELDDGTFGIVSKDKVISLKGYDWLRSFDEDLKAKYREIVKIYHKDTWGIGLVYINDIDTGSGDKLLWQRTPKITLTDDEKVILRNLDKRYKKIFRCEDGFMWMEITDDIKLMLHFDNLFKSITHESGIHEIKELLK